MSQKTSKKIKVVGYESFINAKTGEIEDLAVTSIEEKDFNFTKVWMKNLIFAFDLIGNTKTKVAFWIIDNLNRENQLIYTQRQIAEKTETSLKTVSTVMKFLQEVDFIRKIGSAYVVNPNFVYKGSHNGRMNLLMRYNSEPQKELTDDEKIANLYDSMTKIQKQIDHLENRGKNSSKVIPIPTLDDREKTQV